MRRDCAGYHRCSENRETVGAACRPFGRNKRRARQGIVEGKRPRADRCRRSGGCGAEDSSSNRKRSHKSQVTVMISRLFVFFALKPFLGFGARGLGFRMLLLVSMTLSVAVRADDLPRKSKAPRESYPQVDVIYDSVKIHDGTRLRSIITSPPGAQGTL